MWSAFYWDIAKFCDSISPVLVMKETIGSAIDPFPIHQYAVPSGSESAAMRRTPLPARSDALLLLCWHEGIWNVCPQLPRCLAGRGAQ